MNRIARVLVAFGLAAAASTALAAKPLAQMSEAEMDAVTGGGVVDVLVADALNGWSINLEVALQANVAANVNAGVALIGSAQAIQGVVSQLQVTGNLS